MFFGNTNKYIDMGVKLMIGLGVLIIPGVLGSYIAYKILKKHLAKENKKWDTFF